MITNHGPLLEFLYHCRNAAAHDGRFTFTPNEPRYQAGWRGLEIDGMTAGRPLFFDDPANKDGFLKSGDPIRLLADIDATIPD